MFWNKEITIVGSGPSLTENYLPKTEYMLFCNQSIQWAVKFKDKLINKKIIWFLGGYVCGDRPSIFPKNPVEQQVRNFVDSISNKIKIDKIIFLKSCHLCLNLQTYWSKLNNYKNHLNKLFNCPVVIYRDKFKDIFAKTLSTGIQALNFAIENKCSKIYIIGIDLDTLENYKYSSTIYNEVSVKGSHRNKDLIYLKSLSNSTKEKIFSESIQFSKLL